MREKTIVDRKLLSILSDLGNAVTQLDDTLFGRSKKKYTISIKKLRPFYFEKKTWHMKNNNKIYFEVRSKENNHNEPHFHITIAGEGSGSYRISDFVALESSIPRSTEKKLLKWAEENRNTLVATWNELHGNRVIVQ